MSENAFLQPREFYGREINPIGQYVEQMSHMLAASNNCSVEEAKAFLVNGIRSKQIEIKDPVVDYFGRDQNLDRTTEQLTLSHYIKDTLQKKEILTPTFTTYCHPDEERSLISEFIGENVKRRAAAKKAEHTAETAGNHELAFSKGIEQANKKENNNSMSGAFATDSSIFENETGHNTLTSITRSMASVGNALNERMIGGNRHYRNRDAVYNNIAAIITTMDNKSLVEAMKKFNLVYPKAEQLLEILRESMRYYIFDRKVYEELGEFLQKLTPLQRAAVAYNQDFLSLRKLNPESVRKMIDQFSHIDRSPHPLDPVTELKKRNALTINYAHQVLIEEVKGMGVDHSKMPLEVANVVANVCKNIDDTVDYYRPLIKAFFLTKTVPNSTAYIKDMMRNTVVLSDTDSTMFSIDEWVVWYFGKLEFSQHAYGVAGAVMYISTQCIAHCLAILSGNMGVADENLFTLAMKPEFVFPVFVQSPVAKHYFTARLVKEGSVLKDIAMEIKGVHNKNSALPTTIVEPSQKRMENIIRSVMAGKQLSIRDNIKESADVERMILNSLKNSETEYLKRSNIKEASAYGEGPKKSNFQHHTLWDQVFAPKYGKIPPPPYDTVKIPSTLVNPSSFRKWLENMEDRDLAERMKAWALDHNKVQLPTFYLSIDYVQGSDIPKEIMEVMDYRKIILDLTNINRMMLSSLGWPCRENMMLVEMNY